MHLRLENFDGPLDLLLHLIKAQEINIFNIPVSFVTDQYLSFLRQTTDLDFHTAGEYLSMAAQLIELKARLLIPILQNQANLHEEAQSLEDIPEDDPRKPLVEQLLEFEALKKAAEILNSYHLLGRDIFPSGESKRREEEFTLFEYPIQGNPFDLVISFEKVLLKYASQMSAPKVKVQAQKITLQQKMQEVKRYLQQSQLFYFHEIWPKLESRYELVITLMALLELAKVYQVILSQEAPCAPLQIRCGQKFQEEVPEPEASLGTP
jgi:segregation and condensation protein A